MRHLGQFSGSFGSSLGCCVNHNRQRATLLSEELFATYGHENDVRVLAGVDVLKLGEIEAGAVAFVSASLTREEAEGSLGSLGGGVGVI